MFALCLGTFANGQDSMAISSIQINGNLKTKNFIIEKELTFKIGDRISRTDFEKTHKPKSIANLQNTRLFNFIEIKDSASVIIISVIERWYFWPTFTLENADRNFNNWWKDKNFNHLSFGVFLELKNFRGRNETIRFKGQVGFEQELGFSYFTPYLSKNGRTGASIGAGYKTNREVVYGSIDNKQLFYSSEIGKNGREWIEAHFGIHHRSSLNNTHILRTEYNNITIEDSIAYYSEDYLKNNQTSTNFFYMSYQFKHERRDNVAYPLKGHTIQVGLKKTGLGLLQNENLNLLESSLRADIHIPLKHRFYWSSGIKAKWNFLDYPPYALQEGLGYTFFTRGYEYYVMDAQSYYLFQSNLKFNILKKKNININLVNHAGLQKFFLASYMNVFLDLGRADDALYAELNPLSNKLIGGYGIGLDFISTYDLVFRIETTRNFEGENGVYLHFTKAI